MEWMSLPDDKLKNLVLKSRLVTSKLMEEAVSQAVTTARPLEDTLVEKDMVTDEQLGTLIAKYYQVPFINLAKLTIPESVFYLIPERMARKFKIIAFARDSSGLKIAAYDPTQKEILGFLAKKTRTKVIPHYATALDVVTVLRAYEKDLQKTVDSLLKEEVWSPKTLLEDPPVAKIVDLLIDTAYQARASDIHIEPGENDSLARFRIDGLLQDALHVPKFLHDRIVTRIKVLSNLRTDEHLAPQDGKMRVALEEETIDIRVSIIPVVAGEKAVLRLLSTRTRELSFADLGMNEADLKKVAAAYSKSYGMILSTGPTGSGKTTSIYSVLKILNTREKNITTVEDPVEYQIKGANQIQVNPKANLTFATGLRSILRQDPNIIFVGEIRDADTAGIAVNAALTGHLVLSTLHTNDAATAIPRLSDMKVEPFLVASTVSVIIAQRLVRRICNQCKQSHSITLVELVKNFPEAEVRQIIGSAKTLTIYTGRGCKACRFTGYAGRVGLFEVLEVNNNIRKLITQKSDSDVIAGTARQQGMKTMLEDGLDKIKHGVTTVEEVLRVTKAEFLS